LRLAVFISPERWRAGEEKRAKKRTALARIEICICSWDYNLLIVSRPNCLYGAAYYFFKQIITHQKIKIKKG
jgi:hypothetical protein